VSVIERRHVVCSACHVACGLIVDVVDGRPGKIHGNKDNPVYHGYSCIKGRQLAAYAASPERLLQSMRRQPGGGYAAIGSARAAREIALQLRQIIDAHGPRAVAIYVGTHGYNNFPSHAYAEAILQAIGSPMLFNAVSIDQPGKAIAFALHGPWLAGTPGMDSWDSLLLIGTNPIVTMNGGLGANPARWLHAARQRGLKLVVVDPRKTEVAAQADVHLAIRPGEDAAVLAGIARIIIAESLFDQDFVQANTTGFAALRDAVHGFTPEYVAARADISAEALMQAARLFAAGRSGAVSAGTGPNMAPHGNVTEYFVKVLTTLKGFWRRAGEPIGNPGVMVNRMPPLAASPGPLPVKGYGHKMRIRGLEESPAGLPTATLAEEMLMPGEGQVKALLVLGGNPAAAWPDQQKTVAALQSLDLLVSVDPVMSATARLAHYVIAPKIGLERPVATMHNEFFGNFGPGWGYEVPYAQFSPACMAPPDGSDLVEEWQMLHAIAQHLDLKLRLRDWSFPDPAEGRAAGTDIDMDRMPDADEIWTALTRNAPVPFAEVKRHAAEGHVFDRPKLTAQPPPEGWSGRLDIGNPDLLAELVATLADDDRARHAAFPFRLISRRLHDVVNSCWHAAPLIADRVARNGAFMNPADLAAAGYTDGDIADICSPAARITAILREDRSVRAGCISMSHAWGANPDEPADPARSGGNTGRLVSLDREFDRFTGIPRMSAIPVRLERSA
jgi:anaerobic selenocysteine-containing dehydrogenase